MMDFAEAHMQWLQSHLDRRQGERKGRLARGHQHAEQLFLRKVWWPLFGHFEHLHPEYEVLDWRRRSYFADFAWLPGHVRLFFEIKGFATHVRDMDRERYCDELNRETFLLATGGPVVSFAYDDVDSRSELCMQMLQMLLSRYRPERQETGCCGGRVGKEVLLLAHQLARPLRPKDVEVGLGVSKHTAILYLQQLSQEGWLRPQASGQGMRIRSYALTEKPIHKLRW